jgi:hypothetical protein
MNTTKLPGTATRHGWTENNKHRCGQCGLSRESYNLAAASTSLGVLSTTAGTRTRWITRDGNGTATMPACTGGAA